MAAVKQEMEPYEVKTQIGKRVTVWTTNAKSHCIVGYGPLRLLGEKVDWIWDIRKRSDHTIMQALAVSGIALLASIACGLCSGSPFSSQLPSRSSRTSLTG